MNIKTIVELEQGILDTVFANENWKNTDYYELCSESDFYGNAHLAMLSKEYSPTATAALITLLLRAIMENKLIDEIMVSSSREKAFSNTLVSSGFFIDTLQGAALDINQFWNDYSEITDSILSSPNAVIIKNGDKIEACDLLKQNEAGSVIAFANSWNNRQYFIETGEAWLFFDWSTMM